MPIYEYRCEKCGNEFEVIQKISDSPLEACPSCKGLLTKLISQTAFQLKGSGWYLTDYARKSEVKSETKSDAKSESKNGDKETKATETPSKSEPPKIPKK
ncbi:MAG: FmdB family transcriptional regulator [Acidobacteria bacterium]|nr:MAG: FmdB family transcriptional regulator [Acidobacteriota bacterium]